MEKTGEGLGEKTLEQVGKLWQRVKAMPVDTFGALKPARENPFPEDFEQAIWEMEAVANQNPEFKQDIIDVVAVAEEENPEYIQKIEAELEKINALFRRSTITGGVLNTESGQYNQANQQGDNIIGKYNIKGVTGKKIRIGD